MFRKILFSLVAAGLMTAVLVQPTSSVGSTRQKYGYHYACVCIHSDPVGARVYGEDGSDWGQTTEEKKWVRRSWGCPDPNETYRCAGREYTITLKKPGQKTTYHTFTWYFKYSSAEEACAEKNRQEITVVLDD